MTKSRSTIGVLLTIHASSVVKNVIQEQICYFYRILKSFMNTILKNIIFEGLSTSISCMRVGKKNYGIGNFSLVVHLSVPKILFIHILPLCMNDIIIFFCLLSQ